MNKMMISGILAGVLIAAALAAVMPLERATTIHPRTFGTAAIPDGAVTNAKLAADAVTTDKIAADTITGADIAPDTITAAEIAANGVATAEITDDAVTAAKLAGSLTATGAIRSQTVVGTASPLTTAAFTPTVTSTALVFVASDVLEAGATPGVVTDAVTFTGTCTALGAGQGTAAQNVGTGERAAVSQVVIISGCTSADPKTITSTLTTTAGDTINAHRITVIWLPE